jgi:hypothetical protein
MEVVGADGVHVGTIDKVEGSRLKLIKADSGQGSHQGHHHYLSTGLVAEVEGNTVRLSTTGANAFMFREEQDERTPAIVRTVKDLGLDWTKVGLGGAAIAALFGSALLARGRKSHSNGFELQLQTDENVRLISSSKVEGTAVVSESGEHLGRIESFMVDKYSGRVAYAVLSFGGTFGLGESLFPLPWSLLNYDDKRDGYVLNITKEQLANAPKFKPSEAPEFSAEYRRNVGEAYANFAQ